MIRFLEPFFFTSIAVAGHVALFSAAPVGMPPASGDQGSTLISLQATPQNMGDLVAAWNAPPETMTEVAMPAPEEAPSEAAPENTPATRPEMAAPVMPAMPKMALPQPALDSPSIDTSPAAQPKPKPKPKPPVKAQKKPTKSTPKPAAKSNAQAAQKSAGTGNKGNAGKNGTAKTATKKAANSPKALSQWHAGIRSRIERKKRAPRNCRASGTAKLRIKVATSGQVVGLSLAQSSGNAALDKAAISAARGARLPAAPRGVSGATTVILPIRFKC